MDDLPIELPITDLRAFCQRWRIVELSLFGSVLREDFGSDSDVDFLVTFGEGSHWSLLDLVAMEEELAELLGRSVDIVTRASIERSANHRRRGAILSAARKLDVA